MKILVIGQGGREHAIVWRLSQSRRVSEIYCAPGNAGIEDIAKCCPIDASDVGTLLDFVRMNRIDLTIVGPEAPLAIGISDFFRRKGHKIFGPSKEAAALETSKAFAKDFFKRYNIPCAASETFNDSNAAITYVRSQKFPIVVKADGLASGKGVFICRTAREAENAIDDILEKKIFGEAGNYLIIEEFLEGEEASFITVCDGNHVLPLEGAVDHKAIFDGDRGPNTGGMGALSPAKVLTNDVQKIIMEKIMLPTARGLVTEGMPFVGALYAGLMIKDGVPKVLEFNVRFGDPETQSILMRLKTDLLDVIEAAVWGRLDKIALEWDPRAAVCVVMSSKGYPGAFEKGKVIKGLSDIETQDDLKVFHAATKKQNGEYVTDGGRVLGVTALGFDLDEAIDKAYKAVEKISFEGAYYRKDIGRRK